MVVWFHVLVLIKGWEVLMSVLRKGLCLLCALFIALCLPGCVSPPESVAISSSLAQELVDEMQVVRKKGTNLCFGATAYEEGDDDTKFLLVSVNCEDAGL